MLDALVLSMTGYYLFVLAFELELQLEPFNVGFVV